MRDKSIDVKSIYLKINFVDKYKKISQRHNDFEKRLYGNKKDVYDEILKKFHYEMKYFKNESFYRIEETVGNIIYTLQLMLKNGIVEPALYTKINDIWAIPSGRFDFICESIDDYFSRLNYPIPVYTSEQELKSILNDIFSIYEGFKQEFIENYLGK